MKSARSLMALMATMATMAIKLPTQTKTRRESQPEFTEEDLDVLKTLHGKDKKQYVKQLKAKYQGDYEVKEEM